MHRVIALDSIKPKHQLLLNFLIVAFRVGEMTETNLELFVKLVLARLDLVQVQLTGVGYAPHLDNLWLELSCYIILKADWYDFCEVVKYEGVYLPATKPEQDE